MHLPEDHRMNLFKTLHIILENYTIDLGSHCIEIDFCCYNWLWVHEINNDT